MLPGTTVAACLWAVVPTTLPVALVLLLGPAGIFGLLVEPMIRLVVQHSCLEGIVSYAATVQNGPLMSAPQTQSKHAHPGKVNGRPRYSLHH